MGTSGLIGGGIPVAPYGYMDNFRSPERARTFNLEEADAATSDNDFVAKMRISAREAKEGLCRHPPDCQLQAARRRRGWKVPGRGQSTRCYLLDDRSKQEGQHEITETICGL
jgi:hypothetical protein